MYCNKLMAGIYKHLYMQFATYDEEHGKANGSLQPSKVKFQVNLTLLDIVGSYLLIKYLLAFRPNF